MSWSIWLQLGPLGEVHASMWISLCSNNVPTIIRSFSAQYSASLSTFSFTLPIRRHPITLSQPRLSWPTLAFASPIIIMPGWSFHFLFAAVRKIHLCLSSSSLVGACYRCFAIVLIEWKPNWVWISNIRLVWFLPSDLPGMIEFAKEIELPAGIALGIVGTHKLPYHCKATVHEGRKQLINHTNWYSTYTYVCSLRCRRVPTPRDVINKPYRN